jgi:hypothetical protein
MIFDNESWKIGYIEGLKEGIRRYAIWKDGVQMVGVMQRPLSEVLREIKGNEEVGVRIREIGVNGE